MAKGRPDGYVPTRDARDMAAAAERMEAEEHGLLRQISGRDDIPALASAARAGMGAPRIPLFLGRATAGLVPHKHIPLQPYAPVWMLAHKDLKQAPRVAAMKRLIVPWFRASRGLFTRIAA